MASRDLPSAPYPWYAEPGGGSALSFRLPRVHERYWLYLTLFFTTLCSTTAVGAALQFDFDRNIPFDLDHGIQLLPLFVRHPAMLLGGLPFSLTLLSILLAHEFGHYLTALYNGVDASLPYFLPSPVLGTFGAFIRIRSAIFSKRILFDIGASGPIAGFIFLLPALAIGLAFSKIVPGIGRHDAIHFGVPAIEWLLQQAIFPGVAAGDIYLHPVGRAAWVGMFATTMNLLPVGQLDGGHILYAFFPRRHRLISKMVAIAMLPLGFFWLGWTVWGIVLLVVGRWHPSIYDAAEPGPGRTRLAILATIIFLLCFMYAPIGAGGF